jgi:Tfp pilus assembly protein PilN
MMKINLLGGPKVVAAAEAPSVVAPAAIIIPAVVLIATGLVVLIWYFSLRSSISDLNTKIEAAKRTQAELADIKRQAIAFKAQLDELQQRKDTVDSLASSRQGPVELMRALGVTATRANDLYFSSVVTSGNHLTIKGEANSPDTVADFLSHLQGSGSFTDVKLQQSFQNDKQSRTNFDFTLNCNFVSSATPAPTVPAAQQGGAAAAGRRTGH